MTGRTAFGGMKGPGRNAPDFFIFFYLHRQQEDWIIAHPHLGGASLYVVPAMSYSPIAISSPLPLLFARTRACALPRGRGCVSGVSACRDISLCVAFPDPCGPEELSAVCAAVTPRGARHCLSRLSIHSCAGAGDAAWSQRCGRVWASVLGAAAADGALPARSYVQRSLRAALCRLGLL